ncbi:MAG: hypothetical protein QW057_06685 [Candidatus Bathyarchaeia archaeon]
MGKPLILVDKGPWCPEALTLLGPSRRHAASGLRNGVERLFRAKPSRGRTKRFSHNIDARRQGTLYAALLKPLHPTVQPRENPPNPERPPAG